MNVVDSLTDLSAEVDPNAAGRAVPTTIAVKTDFEAICFEELMPIRDLITDETRLDLVVNSCHLNYHNLHNLTLPISLLCITFLPHIIKSFQIRFFFI